MNQFFEQLAGTRTSAATAVIAIICGAFAMLTAPPASAAQIGSAGGSRVEARLHKHAFQLAAEPATAPAPASETGEDDDKDVPTSQVDKYISVYESMQKDHNLTVDQATSKEGLTVAQFRSIEGKIERDDTLRERVRKALRHATNPNDKDSSD